MDENPAETTKRLEAEIARLTAESASRLAALKRLEVEHHKFGPPDYNEDYLRVYNKQLDFMTDPAFCRAYERGITSGHNIGGGGDIGIRYRIHTCTWAARHASKLPGAFVECGVNTGIFSLAVMDYIGFDHLDKKFYLFDTYSGIPEEQFNDQERAAGKQRINQQYFDVYEIAKRNFAPYKNAVLVRGRIPDTLAEVDITEVAYLSIDMNIQLPEMAALRHFWPKLTHGGVVVLDDYAWRQHAYRKGVFDDFARECGVEIMTLPSGQGLILKA
ncbi:MAG TPA: TylF/MycF/NovP-related O-methyltransferase [Hyphomicrobiaceae bacterium]|nr:TylF/MycF/NovP-related O-methyltransferase [Hyphomicrobiaceae bacterium]